MDTTGWDEALRRIEAERAAQTGRLDLSQLGLRALPPALFELTGLEALDLSGSRWEPPANALTDLPPALARLRSLRTLSIAGNPIGSLGAVAGLTTLTTLDCSRTKVSDLEPLRPLVRLQTLDCSRTRVSDLKPLRPLVRLQTLHCSDTRVSDLKPLRPLVRLQTLDCSWTGVSDLEPLRPLVRLQTLDCSGTRVSDLEPLRPLVRLQTLSCSQTGVSDLEPLRPLVHLQTLDCSCTGVWDLEPLWPLVRLQTLDCSWTQVSDLEPLRPLVRLQTLSCSQTGVSDLEPLRPLVRLQTLHCSRTRVSDLEPLRPLLRLQTLGCSHTGVSDLESLRPLARLQTLHCSYTRVSDLEPLRPLVRLQTLDCSHTGVSDLEPVAALEDIRAVHAYRCPLSDLPRALVQRETPTHLAASQVAGCPPEVLSQSYHDNCLPRLRPHLADLAAGAEPLRTTKIIVLGNGRVGKTQLCRRLRGLDFDPTVSSTHGIVIETADFDDDETLNLWDFGGQDIYHGAHALFMRTRAVFVIAWHPDFEAAPTHEYEGMTFRNRPLAYWLAFVKAMGAKGSPVILVQSQCDRREQAVKRLPVPEAVLDGLDCRAVAYSAKTDKGRRKLEAEIADAIEAIRERDGLASIGIGRARVIERLEALRAEDQARPAAARRHRVLDMARFTALCEEVGGVSSPAALLDYLHQCGLVFYDPGRFEGRILLDLSWALDAIYSVFDRRAAWRQLRATGGRFDAELLGLTVWRDHGPDERRLFLHLMLSCGICFRLSHEQGPDAEYVAPDLLPPRDAVAHHLAGRMQGPTRRLVQRCPFLHPGLFRGLMAAIGLEAGPAGVYWRRGLWVCARESGAQVRVDAIADEAGYGGRVEITMQGDDGKLADWLRERLAAQSRRFGQVECAPDVDELPRAREEASPRPETPPGDASAAPEGAPAFDEMPPEAFPRSAPDRPEVFVSYCRAESRHYTRTLAAALAAQGVDVTYDETGTALGDRLGAFMERLIAGDYVIVMLGEGYLRSPWCMYELYGIWQRCQRRGDDFLRRVVPLLLPGTDIDTMQGRAAHARHWSAAHDKAEGIIREDPRAIAPEDFADYKRLKAYHLHVASMLYLLSDRLMPRDLHQLAADDFAPLLELLASG